MKDAVESGNCKAFVVLILGLTKSNNMSYYIFELG